MAALSGNLDKPSKLELVAIRSSFHDKMNSLKSITFNEIKKLRPKCNLGWLKLDILGTKMEINCYPSGTSI